MWNSNFLYLTVTTDVLRVFKFINHAFTEMSSEMQRVPVTCPEILNIYFCLWRQNMFCGLFIECFINIIADNYRKAIFKRCPQSWTYTLFTPLPWTVSLRQKFSLHQVILKLHPLHREELMFKEISVGKVKSCAEKEILKYLYILFALMVNSFHSLGQPSISISLNSHMNQQYF